MERANPLQLPKAFLIASVHGEEAVTCNISMESLMYYITVPEQDVVTKAMDNTLFDEDDVEDFHDLLVRMECHTIPKERNPVLEPVANK